MKRQYRLLQGLACLAAALIPTWALAAGRSASPGALLLKLPLLLAPAVAAHVVLGRAAGPECEKRRMPQAGPDPQH